MNLPSQSAGWAKAEGFLTDPMDAYRRGEIRDLTEAQKFAIENGADINQVVNATRGMSTTITRRPIKKTLTHNSLDPKFKPLVSTGMPDILGGLRIPTSTSDGVGLLTPEGIYRQSAGDREKAIALLREWGYLT